MKIAEFDFLARLMESRSGVVLQRRKSRFLERQLEPVSRRFGFRDVGALLAELPRATESLLAAAVEALLVSDTSFFRDASVFAHFRDRLLPSLIAAKAGERALRIWSAGCSTGQEAYSLAMLLDGAGLPENGWRIEIVGTDLNAAAIQRGHEALYTDAEVERGLTPAQRLEYLRREEDRWRVEERLRRMVRLRTLNLMDGFAEPNACDAIFCRNVLMYFAAETRAAILDKLAAALAPHGFLVFGKSERPAAAPMLRSGRPEPIFYRAA